MTQPKTLSPAEALRALADGKKLTCDEFSETLYVELSRQGNIVNEKDEHFPLHNFEDFTIYTEPRPKRKEIWVEYLASPTCSQVQSAGIYYFREGHIPEHTLWRYTETGRSLEVTIED